MMSKVNQTKQNLFNFGSTLLFNRQERKFQQKMYDRQRADNLADWNMNNEYNSIPNQMARFKEAGLNPNLIYGQVNNAPPIKSADYSGANTTKPELSFQANPFMDYVNLAAKTAQTDNIQAATDVAKQDLYNKALTAENIAADTYAKLFSNKVNDANYQNTLDLAKTNLEAAQANVAKQYAEIESIQAGTKKTINDDARAAVMNAKNVQEAVERIKTSIIQRAKTRQEIKNLEESLNNIKLDGIIKKAEGKLREKGIQPGDKLWERELQKILAEEFEPYLPQTKSLPQQGKDGRIYNTRPTGGTGNW